MGLSCGVLIASMGLLLLSSATIVTGGTAGLSLLLSYALPLPFGLLFVVVNLPFLVLGIWRKGWDFTLRTIVCVIAVSLLTQGQHAVFGDIVLPPVYAALMGNLLAGTGLLILFRHRSSLGGFNIVGLIAQEQFGWRAGWVQLGFDAIVVLASFTVVSPLAVAISAGGAIVFNTIIALNHRPGRYTGY